MNNNIYNNNNNNNKENEENKNREIVIYDGNKCNKNDYENKTYYREYEEYQNKCLYHEKYDIQSICEDCNVSVCSKCITSDIHKRHSFIDIDEKSMESIRNELENQLIPNYFKEKTSDLEILGQSKKRLLNTFGNLDDLKKTIEKEFNEIGSMIKIVKDNIDHEIQNLSIKNKQLCDSINTEIQIRIKNKMINIYLDGQLHNKQERLLKEHQLLKHFSRELNPIEKLISQIQNYYELVEPFPKNFSGRLDLIITGVESWRNYRSGFALKDEKVECSLYTELEKPDYIQALVLLSIIRYAKNLNFLYLIDFSKFYLNL